MDHVGLNLSDQLPDIHVRALVPESLAGESQERCCALGGILLGIREHLIALFPQGLSLSGNHSVFTTRLPVRIVNKQDSHSVSAKPSLDDSPGVPSADARQLCGLLPRMIFELTRPVEAPSWTRT